MLLVTELLTVPQFDSQRFLRIFAAKEFPEEEARQWVADHLIFSIKVILSYSFFFCYFLISFHPVSCFFFFLVSILAVINTGLFVLYGKIPLKNCMLLVFFFNGSRTFNGFNGFYWKV